jgi:anti-anti-sigma factor
MSDQSPVCLSCPLVVLALEEPRIMGDSLADALRDDFLSVYNSSRAIHAVVDMKKVAYLSSAGIRPLLALNRQVHERGGRLLLCNLGTAIEEVLQATRLISGHGAAPAAFERHASVPAAVTSLYQSGGP